MTAPSGPRSAVRIRLKPQMDTARRSRNQTVKSASSPSVSICVHLWFPLNKFGSVWNQRDRLQAQIRNPNVENPKEIRMTKTQTDAASLHPTRTYRDHVGHAENPTCVFSKAL